MFDKIVNAYLLMNEMTSIYKDHEISATDMHNDITQLINKIHHLSHNIGSDHFAVQLPNGNMYLYHKNGNTIHSASLFERGSLGDRNAYRHALTSKGDSISDASGIYKNIQFIIDNGKTVTSDDNQTRGGRNLWRNIHKHVNFGKASLYDIKTGKHVKDVDNFESLSKTDDDPYVYSIKK